MKYKVAVATYSGEKIDLHFGHCTEFSILEVTDNEKYEFTDSVDTARGCDSECNHDRILQVAEALKDCKYILSAKIGPGAAYIVKNTGPIPLEIEADIDYAIQKLMVYDGRQARANTDTTEEE